MPMEGIGKADDIGQVMRQYQQEDIRGYDQPELGVAGQASEQGHLGGELMAKRSQHGVIYLGRGDEKNQLPDGLKSGN